MNEKWINADERKPEYNKGVLVFIPDEDFHITSGMWDISDKWVLLDDYRKSECKVTHWMELPKVPEQFKKEIQDINEAWDLFKKCLKPLPRS